MTVKVPASIRFNNPGAMWGGNALARKWGAGSSAVKLNDGLGQGNNIAFFPDKVHGACAQFDLWHTSRNYRNKPLRTAITTWSGGNEVASYLQFLKTRVPGLADTTAINDAFLSSPSGVAFVRAQAWHEAGQPYPMSDDEWRRAQQIVFGGGVVVVPSGEDFHPLVRPGDGGPAVEVMQRLLGVPITGVYVDNSVTEDALRKFQVDHGLKNDGKCGPATWDKLDPEQETNT